VKRVLIKGFIIIDYFPRFPEGIAEMAKWLAEGRIHYRTDVVDGLENAPEAVNRLFDGQNVGKLLVRCSPEPT
jgi:NADPH-dependent curcumin reductase CurA